MKAMLTGFVVMIAVSAAAYYTLSEIGFSSAETQSGANVRLD